MERDTTPQELWEALPSSGRSVQAAELTRCPSAARRYLEHAIAPGTPLAQTVRLQMRGEIKLRKWLPFTAEEVIAWGHGFIWGATVRMFGMPIRGSDRWLHGQGSMRWRLLGLVPVMTAAGPDITRSAAGRMNIEAVWLPSVFCRQDVSWNGDDATSARAQFHAHDEDTQLDLTIDPQGRLEMVRMSRWGNPDETAFRYADFGALVEEEKTFDGYTIPTRLRIGWYIGTERFESEGEFFRATVTHAAFR